MRPFTAEEIARFDDDGFIIADEILSKSQVDAVLASSDRVQNGEYNGDRRPPGLRKPLAHFGRESSIAWYLNARIVDRDLWSVTTDGALGAAAATLLRTATLSLVEDQLLDKPAPGLPCNFHQDYGYWRFSSSTQMISCWIALVDMTIEMGPLELIPGSHRWGHISNPRELIAGSEESWLEAVERARPPAVEPRFVRVCVSAGGGAFFHSLTFHGSGRNLSGVRRRALSIHWAGEECRVDRSQLAEYSYPYMFAGIPDGGEVVNKYMPRVYSAAAATLG
jgi:ectoine hydroxylase-related dioxygenase (phytanoyl-CoA dioxygenase family)